MIDLRRKLAGDLKQSVQRGYYHVRDGKLVDEHGDPPNVQGCIDAALMHKGMKMTAFAFNLPNGTSNPNAPQETHTIGLTEGSDSLKDIRAFAQPIIDAMNNVINNPKVKVDASVFGDGDEEKYVIISFTMTGDQVFN